MKRLRQSTMFKTRKSDGRNIYMYLMIIECFINDEGDIWINTSVHENPLTICWNPFSSDVFQP